MIFILNFNHRVDPLSGLTAAVLVGIPVQTHVSQTGNHADGEQGNKSDDNDLVGGSLVVFQSPRLHGGCVVGVLFQAKGVFHSNPNLFYVASRIALVDEAPYGIPVPRRCFPLCSPRAPCKPTLRTPSRWSSSQSGLTPSTSQITYNDSVVWHNTDGRENITHRIVLDFDGDGLFNGTDDWDSGELVPECNNTENDNGTEASEDECNITFLVWFNGTWGVGEYNYQDMLSDGTVLNGTIVVVEDVHVENLDRSGNRQHLWVV